MVADKNAQIKDLEHQGSRMKKKTHLFLPRLARISFFFLSNRVCLCVCVCVCVLCAVALLSQMDERREKALGDLLHRSLPADVGVGRTEYVSVCLTSSSLQKTLTPPFSPCATTGVANCKI